MRLLARLTALAAALILAVSCLDDPTGLSERAGGISLQPRFANAMAAAIVDIHKVRVVLRRPGQPRILVDTVVLFPVTRDTLKLGIEVPIVSATEELELTLAMTNAAGDTVFRAGPLLVIASTDPSRQTPSAPVFTYVGTGADASGVRFVNAPPALLFGQTVTLAAEAFDAQELTIEGTPVGFELVQPADSVFAKFLLGTSGGATLVAGTARATVQVRAVLPGGQSATHTIAIQPAGAGIVTVSGDQQTGTVGALLELPLVARVFGADELPVQGEVVEFVVYENGQVPVFTQRDTSDAEGLVSLALTLPDVAAPYAVFASVIRNPDLVARFGVTATAAVGSRLSVVGEPAGTTVAGAPITPGVRVAVVDGAGNIDVTATDPITVALGANPNGMGQLSGTLTATPVDGVATFSDLSVQRAVAGYTIVATSDAMTPDTTVVFSILAGAPSGLGFFVQPPLAVVMGTPFEVEVGAVDAFGNPTPTWSGTVTVSLAANPGAGTLGGTLSGTSVDGTVTFSTLQIDNTGVGYSLDAVAAAPANLGVATSNVFDVNIPASVTEWINPQGGNWSDGANWNRGTVPTSSDIVWVKLDGTYTVNVDVPITVSRMEMGAETGTQTLNVAPGGVLRVNEEALLAPNVSLVQAGGEISGPGDLDVAGSYLWTGGNINGVGRTSVLAGGTLEIGGTTLREFRNRRVELHGTGTWTGTHTVSSDSGAQLRVLAGASLDIQGDPTWRDMLTGAEVQLRVTGTLTRTMSTGAATLPALAVEGSLTINTGSLVVAHSDSGSGTMNIAAGAQLALTGTTHSFGAASAVQGAGMVSIAAGASVETAGVWSVASTTVMGTFVYNGAAGSTGSLILSGTRSGTGTLVVDTTMTWSEGALSGTGITRVAPTASLIMNGAVAPASRTISGHTLVIDGPTTWGDAATLHGGLGARVVNSGVFRWEGAGAFANDLGGVSAVFENTASGTLETRGDALGTRVMNFAFDNLGSLGSLGNDTLRFSGGSVNNFGGTTIIEVGALALDAGTYALTAPWEVFGSLTVSGSGVLDLGADSARVGGNLAVVNGGAVRSTMPTSVLRVEGNASFAGGPSVLTDGRLGVTGNFTQSGATTPASFAPTGTHVTTLNGTGPQTISFATPAQSQFRALDIRSSVDRNIVLASDVRIVDSLTMAAGAGQSNLIGAGTTERLTIGGLLRMAGPSTRSPRIGVPVVELSMAPVIGGIALGGLEPDTAVLTGNITSLPNGAGIHLNHVRVAVGGAFSAALPDTIAGDLDIESGTVNFGAPNFSIGGKLRTRARGSIGMTVEAIVTVRDSAIFGGDPTAGRLTAGRLILNGAFAQVGGDPAAFSATGTHVTELAAVEAQAVVFANPGIDAGTSHFGELQIGNASAPGIQLETSAFAVGRLLSTPNRIAISRIWSSSRATLAVEGMAADSITFDAVPLSIGESAPFTTMSVITFQNMDPNANQLTITRTGGTYTFLNQLVFSTPPGLGSYHIVVNNTDPSVMTMDVGNPLPVYNTMVGPPPRYLLAGTPQPILNWSGQTLPPTP